MQPPNNSDFIQVDAAASMSPRDKSEIYAAVYRLNYAIHQVLNSINFLDRHDLGLPFLNGYRILAEEIRCGINFTTAEALSIVELREHQIQEKQKLEAASSNTEEDAQSASS